MGELFDIQKLYKKRDYDNFVDVTRYLIMVGCSPHNEWGIYGESFSAFVEYFYQLVNQRAIMFGYFNEEEVPATKTAEEQFLLRIIDIIKYCQRNGISINALIDDACEQKVHPKYE